MFNSRIDSPTDSGQSYHEIVDGAEPSMNDVYLEPVNIREQRSKDTLQYDYATRGFEPRF